MSTLYLAQTKSPDFLSETYHGRQIAAYRHSQGWLVYLDRVMQQNRQFATAEDAVKWLRRKIDDRDFDERVVNFGRRPLRRTGLARAA